MLEQIQPAIVQVLQLVIPALGMLVLAVITRATQKWQAGKQAAINVEFSPLAQQGVLSGEQKLKLAVDQLRSRSTPLMARMSEAEAVRIVEAVLPEVTRLSDASALRPVATDTVKILNAPPSKKPPRP